MQVAPIALVEVQQFQVLIAYVHIVLIYSYIEVQAS